MKKTLSILVAVIVICVSAVPVFAAPSPTAGKEYNIIVHNNDGGSGSYTVDTDKDGKHATITAHPKKGYKFVKWIITGKYKIEKGNLKSKKLSLLLNGDVEATPYFKKIGSKSTTGGTPVKINTSPTSPKTGDNTIYFIVGVSALGLIAISALGVKLAKSKK